MECLCMPSWVFEFAKGIGWIFTTFVGILVLSKAYERRKGS